MEAESDGERASGQFPKDLSRGFGGGIEIEPSRGVERPVPDVLGKDRQTGFGHGMSEGTERERATAVEQPDDVDAEPTSTTFAVVDDEKLLVHVPSLGQASGGPGGMPSSPRQERMYRSAIAQAPSNGPCGYAAASDVSSEMRLST